MRKNNQKKYLAQIAILALVVSFLVGYSIYTSSSTNLATPSPSPTVSWFVYTDKNASYSIRYPQEFLIKDVINFLPSAFRGRYVSYVSFSSVYKQNPETLQTKTYETPVGYPVLTVSRAGVRTVDEWFKKYQAEVQKRSGNLKFYSNQTRRINDLPALVVVHENVYENGISKHAFIVNKGLLFDFYYDLSEKDQSESIDRIFESMLSSFNFAPQ